jgi:hypothetical protein
MEVGVMDFFNLRLGCDFLVGLFRCELAGCKDSCVCHVDAEEEQEGFAFGISGSY